MLVVTLLIAFLFIRTVKGPVDALNARTKRIAVGDRTALEPLEHHGTREKLRAYPRGFFRCLKNYRIVLITFVLLPTHVSA